MRNHVHWLFLLLLSETAYGQLEKGQGLLTGSISSSFSHSSYSGSFNTRQILANGSVGYGKFVRNNVLLGAEVTLGFGQSRNLVYNDVTQQGNYYSASIAPFARYYWQYGKWLVYTGGGVSIAGSRTVNNYNDLPSSDDRRMFSATLTGQAGLIYPLSHRIGVEVYAQSDGLPLTISRAGLGLVLFTGRQGTRTELDTTAEFSQVNRGRFVLSASFSTMRSRSDVTTSETAASLGIGYFIHDRTQLGIQGGYTIYDSYRYMAIAPYLKRYVSKGALTPYVKASLYVQATKASGPALITYGSYIGTGLAYMLGKRFIAEAELVGLQVSYASIGNDFGVARFWTGSVSATLRPGFTMSYVFR